MVIKGDTRSLDNGSYTPLASATVLGIVEKHQAWIPTVETPAGRTTGCLKQHRP